MKQVFLFLICAVSLISCATSTGVLKLGPDTYKMSAYSSPARGGTSDAEVKVLSTAEEYCNKQGKELLVQHTKFQGESFEAVFHCLDKNDPSYKRPVYQQDPAIVIKNETK